MTPLLAELRVKTYSERYGNRTSSFLRAEISRIDKEIRGLSLYSREYKRLSQERFELNSYADSLDAL